MKFWFDGLRFGFEILVCLIQNCKSGTTRTSTRFASTGANLHLQESGRLRLALSKKRLPSRKNFLSMSTAPFVLLFCVACAVWRNKFSFRLSIKVFSIRHSLLLATRLPSQNRQKKHGRAQDNKGPPLVALGVRSAHPDGQCGMHRPGQEALHATIASARRPAGAYDARLPAVPANAGGAQV